LERNLTLFERSICFIKTDAIEVLEDLQLPVLAGDKAYISGKNLNSEEHLLERFYLYI
jgi:hypothetical protein